MTQPDTVDFFGQKSDFIKMRLLIGLLISLVYVGGGALEGIALELQHQRTIHITHSHPVEHDHDHSHTQGQDNHDHSDESVPHSHCVSLGGGCSHCLTLPNIGLSLVTIHSDSTPIAAHSRLYDDPLVGSIFRPPIAA